MVFNSFRMLPFKNFRCVRCPGLFWEEQRDINSINKNVRKINTHPFIMQWSGTLLPLLYFNLLLINLSFMQTPIWMSCTTLHAQIKADALMLIIFLLQAGGFLFSFLSLFPSHSFLNPPFFLCYFKYQLKRNHFFNFLGFYL